MPRIGGMKGGGRLSPMDSPLLDDGSEAAAVEMGWSSEMELMREETDSDDSDAGGGERDIKQRILDFLMKLPVQIALLMLLVLDMVILVALIIMEDDDGSGGEGGALLALHEATTANAAIFLVEVWLRAWATGFGTFLCAANKKHRAWNIAEIVVITLCFFMEVITLALTEQMGRGSSLVGPFVIGVFRAFRFTRVGRFLIVAHRRQAEAKRKMRKLVSSDRRRYKDERFDLDLTYITPKIIAMSWPSTGTESFYRNPIKSVAEFLELKHRDNYKVYNLCSEREYDAAPFRGRVERFGCDDHNPGDIMQMHAFCKSAEEWLSGGEGRIIVVHCKGGKGRTGLFICAWLLWSAQQPTAQAALKHFSSLRTDDGPNTQFQGVEGPSQSRYVHYFESYCNRLGRQLPAVRYTLTTVEVGPLPRHCQDAGALWCVALEGSKSTLLWTSHPGRRMSTARQPDGTALPRGDPDTPASQRFAAITQTGGAMDVLSPAQYAERHSGGRTPSGFQFVKYEPGIEVTTDTRLHWFYGADVRSVAEQVFGCWFHPSFVDSSERLRFRKADVDKAHKDRKCKRFLQNFVVELAFENVSAAAPAVIAD
eukprot:TRINITY_DN9461_c0_g3_i1.p1 TRINITY_DN9461_c0_g3~~TRINITY_DN9461_c0_g3_i1.p1  ORF type:complete len:595 (+),score=205.28 TRINITY_DN9461_c0_g3_i1:108-1892(+)